MPGVRYLKFILLFIIAVLGAAGAFATIAPDATRAVLFHEVDWRALSADEQQILKPLANRWASMKYVEREHWRALAVHYKQLPPAEQKRIQRRMQRWAAATPGQRHVARDTYKKFKEKAPAEQKEAIAAWQNYAAAQGMLDDPDERAAPPAQALAANGTAQDGNTPAAPNP